MEAIVPPPIPKAALTIFKLIKLVMCKPKKCVDDPAKYVFLLTSFVTLYKMPHRTT